MTDTKKDGPIDNLDQPTVMRVHMAIALSIIEKCPITKHMITSIKYSTNEEEKATMQQLINSRMCGEPLDETVCCDVIQGKSY